MWETGSTGPSPPLRASSHDPSSNILQGPPRVMRLWEQVRELERDREALLRNVRALRLEKESLEEELRELKAWPDPEESSFDFD